MNAEGRGTLWRILNDDTYLYGAQIQTSGGSVALAFGICDIDEYRGQSILSNIENEKWMRMEKEIVGEFENIKVVSQAEEPCEELAYADGRLVIRAGTDDSDSYYPRGYVLFDLKGLDGEVRGIEERPLEFEHEFSERFAFVFIGEPRTGKTTAATRHFRGDFVDTDAFEHPARIAETALKENTAYVIGKHRNAVAITNKGPMRYADFIAELLRQKGITPIGIGFVWMEHAEGDDDFTLQIMYGGADIAPETLTERFDAVVVGNAFFETKGSVIRAIARKMH